MTASAARLFELASPVVTGTGHDLEDISITAAGKRSVVRVVVDKDGGVTLDEVADVSRALGEALDAADEAEPGLLGTSYVLEVSSPGVDRALTEPRHWRRGAARLVEVTLRHGKPVTGRIVRADDDGVTLDVDGAHVVLAYADVLRGAIQVEFSRPSSAEDDADPQDPA
ncbi:MAG: ribosome maturation protein RimP [Frankiales bacterium]|jgi:ribosome maturation factor RimP|nr:ribosome maturation protein RimP [Frankiales bacterium]